MRTTPVDGFLQAVADGRTDDLALAPDIHFDATVPQWRFTVDGADAVRAKLGEWFRHPARFEELTRTPLPDGELVEFLISWEQDGRPMAAHQMHRLRVEDGTIVSHIAFCGGRWTAALLAEMADAARRATDDGHGERVAVRADR